ncbi:hypothetical protein [Bradyrhizobium ivorense]|uniref:hypothetical protein n=1 Tax=Bradyrhizobium ivorense TaxID=2511166 RepID=UPI001115E829|nr:hypothetical protein [Bradyrhizobium ivorense]
MSDQAGEASENPSKLSFPAPGTAGRFRGLISFGTFWCLIEPGSWQPAKSILPASSRRTPKRRTMKPCDDCRPIFFRGGLLRGVTIQMAQEFSTFTQRLTKEPSRVDRLLDQGEIQGFAVNRVSRHFQWSTRNAG